jgi:dCTP deaminase
MILVDRDIKRMLQQEYIQNALLDNVNAASLDICIGWNALRLCKECDNENYESAMLVTDVHGNRFSRVYLTYQSVFYPGERYLVETKETFHFPKDVAGMVRLKSSRGREFYEHLEAGWIDPGYSGRLTLELINHANVPLPLFPGMPIAQIVFMKTIGRPDKPYQGKYQNDSEVQVSKDLLR